MHVDWQAGRPPHAEDKLSTEEARLLATKPERISAILVALDQRADALHLQQSLASWQGEPLSAIMPGPALLELWEIVGIAENILRAMSWGVIVVVLVGMLTVLWSGLEERRREMAVLRAVGARPRDVFLLVVGEAFLLTLAGVSLGLGMASAALLLLEGSLMQHYGLSLSSTYSIANSWQLFALLLTAGLAAGLLPAWRCYHRSLSDGLSPNVGG